MSGVFPVNPAEAQAFQEQYQQFIESLLRSYQALKSRVQWESKRQKQHQKESTQQEQKAPELKKPFPEAISAFEENSFNETPDVLAAFERVDRNSLNETSNPLNPPEIRITDGMRVVHGRVGSEWRSELTPEHLEKLSTAISTPVGDRVDGLGAMQIEVEGEVLLRTNASSEVELNPSVELVNERHAREPVTEATPTQMPEEETFSRLVGGLVRVLQSVEQLPDGTLKQLLQGQIAQMQTSPPLQELAAQGRLQTRSSLSLWQRTTAAVEQFFQSYRERSRQHQVANTAYRLFHQNCPLGASAYYAERYTISRQGKDYTLSDETGNLLMQWRSTPMGPNVHRSTAVQLNETHYRDFQVAHQQLASGERYSGNLAPVGATEATYFARTQRIAAALREYAARVGSDVEVDGNLAYKWRASPKGRVWVEAKDGRGLLLVQQELGGGLVCGMNERDLAHFEQVVPTLVPKPSQEIATGTNALKVKVIPFSTREGKGSALEF
jgi:hypothetical protein